MTVSAPPSKRPDPLPEPTGAEVAAVMMDIGQALKAREAEIARDMVRLITREIDYTRDDPLMTDLRTASIHANVATIVQVFASDIPLDHLQPPTAAVEYARRLAQREIPIQFLVRAYHMGQNVMTRTCYDEVGKRDLPPALGLAVIKRLTKIIYSYADWITLYVFDTYEAERARWMNVRGNVHSSTVHALLSSVTPDSADFEAETGYRLDRTHLAMILWYSGPDEMCTLNLLNCRARALAHHLHADNPPLITAIDRRTVWLWLPFGPRRPVVDTGEIRAAAHLPERVRLAIGLPGRGLDGFRRSHQQADAAYLVATVPGTPSTRQVVGFGDPGVAVVSLLARDLDSTRTWVREVLGPLADDTEQAATLRDTLSTYYATGESHVHTAQQMTLHRNTVKYRITKALEAAQTTGTPHEKLDIALALQVCHFLGPNVLRPRP